MVGRFLVQSDVQELAQSQGVGYAPGDSACAIDSFEVAHQQASEVGASGERGAAVVVGVEGGALLFGELIELLLFQEFVEASVERVAGCCGQFRMRQPEGFLPLTVS